MPEHARHLGRVRQARLLRGGLHSKAAQRLAPVIGNQLHRRRQINPDQPSGLQLRPLPRRGERFPVDDPDLEPLLGPRPVSDALFLQGLLEGLAAIERDGWQRLQALGAPPIGRVISLGGGAHNPQWRRIRERCLAVPVANRPKLSAAAGVAQLALRALQQEPGATMGGEPTAPAAQTP